MSLLNLPRIQPLSDSTAGDEVRRFESRAQLRSSSSPPYRLAEKGKALRTQSVARSALLLGKSGRTCVVPTEPTPSPDVRSTRLTRSPHKKAPWTTQSSKALHSTPFVAQS
ncbi:hypothetical protein [Saccharibacillus kuerlensis]|uniref:hypothetical protein n=1 Tax=Saccharibacillus kuerlensis TaxID=459527 RepID=UPI0012EE285C|nr:hypothetical protein [Saccharibacillus kuerlensis]